MYQGLFKKNGLKVATVLALTLPTVYAVTSPSEGVKAANNPSSQVVAFTHSTSPQPTMDRMSGASRTPSQSQSQPPVISKKLPSITLKLGQAKTINLKNYFTDADSSTLRYSGYLSSKGLVKATISGTKLTIKGIKKGSTSVVLTASDGVSNTKPNTLRITVK